MKFDSSGIFVVVVADAFGVLSHCSLVKTDGGGTEMLSEAATLNLSLELCFLLLSASYICLLSLYSSFLCLPAQERQSSHGSFVSLSFHFTGFAETS